MLQLGLEVTGDEELRTNNLPLTIKAVIKRKALRFSQIFDEPQKFSLHML